MAAGTGRQSVERRLWRLPAKRHPFDETRTPILMLESTSGSAGSVERKEAERVGVEQPAHVVALGGAFPLQRGQVEKGVLWPA